MYWCVGGVRLFLTELMTSDIIIIILIYYCWGVLSQHTRQICFIVGLLMHSPSPNHVIILCFCHFNFRVFLSTFEYYIYITV